MTKYSVNYITADGAELKATMIAEFTIGNTGVMHYISDSAGLLTTIAPDGQKIDKEGRERIRGLLSASYFTVNREDTGESRTADDHYGNGRKVAALEGRMFNDIGHAFRRQEHTVLTTLARFAR